MGVSGITASLMDSMSSLNLNGLLQGKKAKDLLGEVGSDALEDNGALAPQNPVAEIQEQAGALTKNFQNYSGQANNMMARNFVGPDAGESRYIQAMRKSRQAEEETANALNKQTTQLLSLIDECKEVKHTAAYIKMRIQQISNGHVADESERNLRETKESIEKATQEVMTPKDANGNPIPNATEAPSPAPIPEAAPALEPVAEVASVFGTAPAVAPAPELALEVAASAAPAAPKVSIDILV